MQDLGAWDYVVVGAGSAGCVLANRLSADPDVRVLLLEAGGKDNYIWVHIPVGYLYCMGNPRTDWCFTTAPEPGLNGRALNYPRGKVLGGCSSINGMIYMRGQARDYDHWRQLGLTGWGWDDVLPHFRASEDHYAWNDALHGQGGGLRVEEQRLSWEVLDAFRDACEEVGIPKIRDFNTGDNFGSAYFQVNQRAGIRWNTAKGFLRPALGRANLKIVTGAHARRIVIEEGRASALELTVAGRPARASISGELVLAAGSIGSPQLLELSGIGRPDVLEKVGLAVQHELPGVGENLQDHLQLRTIFKVRGARTLNQLAGTLAGKTRIALDYALRRAGPMSMAPSQLGAFARSDPSFETANIEYHVQPLSLDRFGEPLHAFPAITASVCNLRPDSRGHVHIASADAAVQPEIRPNYLSASSDRKVAADSIRLTRRIMAAQALKKYAPEEYLPGARIETDEDLARAAGDIGTTIFHPVGTCRMGADEASVVDGRLRLRGLAGIRVADASVMPTITSGNTNAPTVMIAEKGAAMMREDRRRGGSKAAS
ncbi:GMC family oxidoreductase [Polymorphum gilvum]|uniref:FAD dependent oxidoreductase, putative n=1 Tax=Polymorphum gilvum (strain LMG 25793 / CGMCC 1.9160 / SL003B-26A1) TaxID=991905 RepID=F2IVT2_POLGS|nr:GMC family oxidoreductase N-terminal domain-containing protein [Polymorphum gilvum]ADZ69189.1 FAD dependent oxidoreductase, putative [Polymorphum gilvum SL003B-26A1]